MLKNHTEDKAENNREGDKEPGDEIRQNINTTQNQGNKDWVKAIEENALMDIGDPKINEGKADCVADESQDEI